MSVQAFKFPVLHLSRGILSIRYPSADPPCCHSNFPSCSSYLNSALILRYNHPIQSSPEIYTERQNSVSPLKPRSTTPRVQRTWQLGGGRWEDECRVSFLFTAVRKCSCWEPGGPRRFYVRRRLVIVML